MFFAPVMLKIVVVAVRSSTTRKPACKISGKSARSNTVLLQVPRKFLTGPQIRVTNVAILAIPLLVIHILVSSLIVVTVVRFVVRKLLGRLFALPASGTSTGTCSHDR
jgi:hypothetical protein